MSKVLNKGLKQAKKKKTQKKKKVNKVQFDCTLPIVKYKASAYTINIWWAYFLFLLNALISFLILNSRF